MAGFEVVVRPVVFPDIRPRARPSLPPQDDPTKGFAVIKGNPASSVGLSDNWNVSSSKSRPVETERRVDEATIYQQEDDGKVNKKNFVKVKAANRIKLWYPSEAEFKESQSGIGFGVGKPAGFGPIVRPNFYKRIEETDNIEVTRRDIIEKNPDAPAEATGGNK